MTKLRRLQGVVFVVCWAAGVAFSSEGADTSTSAPSPVPAPAPRTSSKPVPAPSQPGLPQADTEEREIQPAQGVPSLRMTTDFAAPGMSMAIYSPLGQVESRGVR